MNKNKLLYKFKLILSHKKFLCNQKNKNKKNEKQKNFK